MKMNLLGMTSLFTEEENATFLLDTLKVYTPQLGYKQFEKKIK